MTEPVIHPLDLKKAIASLRAQIKAQRSVIMDVYQAGDLDRMPPEHQILEQLECELSRAVGALGPARESVKRSRG
jgi:hypothetical protein